MKVIYMGETIALLQSQGVDTTSLIDENPTIKMYDNKPYLVLVE